MLRYQTSVSPDGFRTCPCYILCRRASGGRGVLVMKVVRFPRARAPSSRIMGRQGSTPPVRLFNGRLMNYTEPLLGVDLLLYTSYYLNDAQNKYNTDFYQLFLRP